MATPLIALHGISVSHDGGRTLAVSGLDLEVAAGEFLVLVGPSGCGKTSTLKCLNRLLEVVAGRVVIDGEDVRSMDPVRLRRSMGYVIQGIGLFPHLPVAANIALVPELLGWSADDIRQRTTELLDLVELPPGEFAHRLPRSLSGGQKQRVGIARALAARPRVMLMDEPFGALDPATRDLLQRQYRDLHDRLGLTTVMVTHDMSEALVLADRIAVLDGGRLVQAGTPLELSRSPATALVSELLQTPLRQARRVESVLGPAPQAAAPGRDE